MLGACRPAEDAGSRALWRRGHAALGWGLLLGAWVNIGLGLALFGANSAGMAGYAVAIVFWLLVAAVAQWRARRAPGGGGIEKNYRKLAMEDPGEDFLDGLLAEEMLSSEEESMRDANALDEYAR